MVFSSDVRRSPVRDRDATCAKRKPLRPPLKTTDEELEFGLAVLEEAFAETAGSMPLNGEAAQSKQSGVNEVHVFANL